MEIRDWVSHAVVVPAWLNAAPEHESVSRVSMLVGQLHHVQSEIDAYPDEEASLTSNDANSKPIPDPAQKVLGHQDEVVGMLCDYFLSHGVEHSWDGHLWNLPLVPVSIPGEFILKRQAYLKDGRLSEAKVEDSKCVTNPVGEGEVLVRIMSLALSGDLYRVRSCRNPGCTTWFYAVSSKKIYCGDLCRFAHDASSPERRKQKNEYKRKARLEDKERQSRLKLLEAAKMPNPSSPRTRQIG